MRFELVIWIWSQPGVDLRLWEPWAEKLEGAPPNFIVAFWVRVEAYQLIYSFCFLFRSLVVHHQQKRTWLVIWMIEITFHLGDSKMAALYNSIIIFIHISISIKSANKGVCQNIRSIQIHWLHLDTLNLEPFEFMQLDYEIQNS